MFELLGTPTEDKRHVLAFTWNDATELEDLGITQLQLSNGVRVNLKPTDFEVGTIRITGRISGAGQLTQPADMPAFSVFASAIIDGGEGAAVADAFGHGDDVGNDALELEGPEAPTHAAEADLDLVGNADPTGGAHGAKGGIHVALWWNDLPTAPE